MPPDPGSIGSVGFRHTAVAAGAWSPTSAMTAGRVTGRHHCRRDNADP